MAIIGLLHISTALFIIATSAAYFFTKLYHARKLIFERRKKGLPVAPDHSFFFGHLLYLKSMIDRLPLNAHYQNAFGDIARQHFSKEGVFYIDLWPVILIVVSPKVAIQIHANPDMSMERPSLLPRFFKPICALVPDMIDETVVYCETLRKLAFKGTMFYLDSTTLRFTIDVIGRTILNAPLGAQRGYNTLADCMVSQIRWHQANAETNPLQHLNLVRWAVHWWNGRQMDKYIGHELDKRYNEYKADPESKRTKSVIDSVLQAYLPENAKIRPQNLDPEFRGFAISQIRLFVFVGHDSISSTICYILHLLATNPDALAQVRAEHDNLLGADLSAVPAMLKEQPHLPNHLPYTTAVIKEALRLFAPGGCSRASKQNVNLVDDQGNSCPTEHAAAFTIHTEMHRAPAYWNRPDEFLPERWLVDSSHELHPMKGAYRAFEIGPRNCVAQGFVMTELRVILACIVREFDFKPAYDEWDRLHPSKGLRTYRGERVYQIEDGSAHPVEHYPCKVSIRGS